MDNDLTDVGLNALDQLEAQDESEDQASTETDEGVKDTEETETSNETSSEDSGDKTNEPTDDSDNAEEGEGESDSTEEEDKGEEDAGEDDKDKELSDEEFEEMAKKRGYTKANTEEETQVNDEQKATMDKLLARPKEIDEELWNELSEESKVIYNALPYLVAEGKDGPVQVKTPDQLPDNFQFKNDKAAMKFQNDLQAQENRATQFKQALDARAERVAQAENDRAIARQVVSEIDALQKSGELPTPKAKQGTKEFDEDPAVVLINKVLGYRAMRAQQGAVLSIRDSLLLYKAENPQEFTKKEAKGDIERRNIAKKVAGNSKSTNSAVNGGDDNKPHYYKPGMSTEDVLDSVLNDMD